MRRRSSPHTDNALYGFGALLTRLRSTAQRKLKQKDIVALLIESGWTTSAYSRLELGELAPRFEQLPTLYAALQQAGIPWTAQSRQQFVELARQRIETQQTHKDLHSDEEWAQLRFTLARMDATHSSVQTGKQATQGSRHPRRLLLETRHLIGRELWREHLLALLATQQHKLLVMRGPSGMGKSSELNWLASWLFERASLETGTEQPQPPQGVILCDLRSEAFAQRPEDALDMLIGTILTELHSPHTQTPLPTLDERLQVCFESLERTTRPLVVMLDHAESLLHFRGTLAVLAPCWERFVSHWLRRRHTAILVLATTQWPGWYGGEQRFVAELALPALSRESSMTLLQQLGLEGVDVPLLGAVYEAVGGIPLCLEWVVALVKHPHFLEAWDDDALAFMAQTGYTGVAQAMETMQHGNDGAMTEPRSSDALSQAVQRLLAEPHVFGGTLAGDLAPLLERVVTQQQLSLDARRLLEALAVTAIPLAKPALQVLCPEGMSPFKELRYASLLASYPDRVQLLPMVAAAILRQLNTEQEREHETLLLEAYKAWRRNGTFHQGEEGRLIAEYATLLLKHGRLLDAAHYLIDAGWQSSIVGYGPQIARLVTEVTQQGDNRVTIEQECGSLLLQYFYSPFASKPIDLKQRARDYQSILTAILTEQITVRPWIETHVVYNVMYCAMREQRFAEAQTILDTQQQRLELRYASDTNARMFLKEKYARLFTNWCEYKQLQGTPEQARALRLQAITLYRECIAFLEERCHASLAKDFKYRLAVCLNELGCHLNSMGYYEEALSVIEQCIALREQGYTHLSGLAESYGEKSQILAALGHFQEALRFDEDALAEIERVALTGHRPSQENICIYHVNRGRLYLRLGRFAEAEQLLQEALPHIQSGRNIYCMLAKEALAEIEQWRQQAVAPQHQLDWRWIARYRELDAFDAYWWWSSTGPFHAEEQEQWEQLYHPQLDEATQRRLGTLLVQAREREITAALTEQREPRFHYPALNIDEVRHRITGMVALDTQISEEEPNAIVRRLYHGALEIEIAFLRMIEATYEGDNATFMACSRLVDPEPTPTEMTEAFAYIEQLIQQGLRREETEEIHEAAHRVLDLMHTQLHLPFDATTLEGEVNDVLFPTHDATTSTLPYISSQSEQTLSAQGARQFFETVLHTCGYDDWHVLIDPQGSVRVEPALRQLFLSEKRLSVGRVRYLLAHELMGHIARATAGERSSLGLLGLGTKYYMAIDEGLAQYYHRQVSALHGQTVEDVTIWELTLSVGLASGVMTPPQTFLALHTFLEAVYMLRRLLKRWDKDVQDAQKRARSGAIGSCLRTFRGVPHLEQAGICYTHDAVYLRGLRQLQQAIAQDATILDRLMVGVTSLECLPDLQELGIGSVPTPQSLRDIAYHPDLDTYILSFEQQAPSSAEQTHSSV